VVRLPGIRLMATGLDHAQWNSGDVVDPARVDVGSVAAWYRERELPWGVRVPAGAAWAHGRHVVHLRMMTVSVPDPPPGPSVAGLTIRPAAPDDLAAVVGVDATAFEVPESQQRPWLALLLAAADTTRSGGGGSDGVTVALAELDGDPVGSGFAVTTAGDAGPAVYVAGIAVLPAARRRGIGGAVSAWLMGGGGPGPAGEPPRPRLAHLHPDTDAAARVYARLGFVEVPGLDVYVANRT
jgi:ribosomal protein S18 acetylase RimI-like enzyme